MIPAHETPLTNGAAGLGASLRAQVPVLRDGDLVLRAPDLGDFDSYASIVCGERADPMGGPLSRDEAWDDFARMTATWLLRGHGVWTVTLGGRVMGFVLIGCYGVDRRTWPAAGLAPWLPMRWQLTTVASLSCFLAAGAT
jgi:RimJ/RimL family protein N-acetyltransferase